MSLGCHVLFILRKKVHCVPGANPGGGGRTRRVSPLKLEKNMIFWRKIVIFHTKYPKHFRASLRNWKKYDFCRKIVIFHTKFPKIFRVSLRSARFF